MKQIRLRVKSFFPFDLKKFCPRCVFPPTCLFWGQALEFWKVPGDSHVLYKWNWMVCVILFLCVCVSVIRSSSPTLKLNKHRFDVTKGSGTSYGELSANITMSYKPIAPAPTGSNHTPPGSYLLLFFYHWIYIQWASGNFNFAAIFKLKQQEHKPQN